MLSNDSDPEGDALTLTISSPPAAGTGTATVVTGGIEFTPAAGSTETGVIGYTITDGNGGEATAAVTVIVTEVITNEPPVAEDGGEATATLTVTAANNNQNETISRFCLLYTSPSPRDQRGSRMPSSA